MNKKEDVKRLVSYAFMFASNLAFGMIFLFVAVSLELFSPFVVRRIFDVELTKKIFDQKTIMLLIGLYIVINVVAMIFQYASIIQLKIMAMKIVQKMRLQIYGKIQELEISFFDNMPAGSIVSKITNDTNAVQGLYVKVLGDIVKSLAYIIGVYVVLFTIQVQFAFIMLLLLPLVYYVIMFYTSKARVYNNSIRTKVTELNAALNETVQGMSIIQSFGAENDIESEYEKTSNDRSESQRKLLNLDSLTSYSLINLFRNLVFTVLIYYFATKVIKSGIKTTVGVLYVYVNYIELLFRHINTVVREMGEMSRSTVASTHVFEMIDKDSKKVSKEKIDDITGIVEFRDVSFYYKDEEYVLKNINIKAERGQVIGLVGHTGSGKSSIMNLLLKFYSPQKGDILIDDKKLSELPDQAIRDYMGIVLQEPYLFTGTVLSNITLDKPNISREDAIKALEMVGADVVLKTLKNGIDEKVVERGVTLSAGQRQLISFARALAQNPKILILDEATSSIDTQTEQIIQDAMKVLMKGRTTFIIAHRLSTIKDADKIYLLEKGKIIERGTHEELVEKKGKYFDMYKMQNI